jgi:hypothetical protein
MADAQMSILTQKKPKVRPGLSQDTPASRLLTKDRGGFSCDGHRLSSLFRSPSFARTRLTKGYAAFSVEKYSTGARGCETPAFVQRIAT